MTSKIQQILQNLTKIMKIKKNPKKKFEKKKNPRQIESCKSSETRFAKVSRRSEPCSRIFRYVRGLGVYLDQPSQEHKAPWNGVTPEIFVGTANDFNPLANFFLTPMSGIVF